MKYVVTVPEIVAGISRTYLPIKAAMCCFMDARDQAPLILPKLQDQISLTLCWCSVDALLTLCWRSVDALLTLCWRSVDALLTLCWRSVDAQFQDVVGRVSMLVLHIKAANTSKMNCDLPILIAYD